MDLTLYQQETSGYEKVTWNASKTLEQIWAY